MRKLVKIAALVFWLCSKVNGEEPMDQFIVHIIETWKVLRPTIVYRGDMPESCYALNFVLCLHNENENKEELVELLTHMHLRREHPVLYVYDSYFVIMCCLCLLHCL